MRRKKIDRRRRANETKVGLGKGRKEGRGRILVGGVGEEVNGTRKRTRGGWRDMRIRKKRRRRILKGGREVVSK